MAERILSGKIKQLIYTTEELSQSPLSTTVIDNGVLVYEKTSSGQIKCKMGDGNNVWSGLNYIEDSDKMDKTNPTGTGSFSMNRLEGSTIGSKSHAEGDNTTASGEASHAEGYYTTASGEDSHAEGGYTTASGKYTHAEGYHTTARTNSQHVQGKYNVEDTNGTYAHIVGGGTSNTGRKNIHTLDWNGNAVFSGDVVATKSDGTEVSLLSLQNEVDTKIDDLAKLVEKHHPKIMTVVIDKTDSNPETCITYADDAIGMTPGSDEWDSFFGHYPCLFKNGAEVGKLNPNNFAQFEDGSSADITSGDAGDVMIAFPKLGYKITSNDKTLTVSMTNGSNVDGYCYLAHTRGTTVKDKFYLGAYKGYLSSSKLRSLSGKKPTCNSDIGGYRRSARANGSGYDQSAYNQLVFRQCMYLLKYKNLDSQTAVGYGYANNNSASISTGGTNAKGMDFGETTGKLQMKLFGLEDFWGNVYEFIDGIFCDSSRNILTATENFNDTGDGYTNQGSSGLSSNTYGYMTDVQGTSEKGFALKSNGGSSSTYYCDTVNLTASKIAVFGGYWGAGTVVGAFTLLVYRSTLDNSDIFSARLMYL